MTPALPRALKTAARVLLRQKDRQDALCAWRRRLAGEPRLPEGALRSVLVICRGNICRSPFAAALLERHDLEVRSAGLDAAERDPADPAAVRVAADFGVSLTDHRSHRLDAEDLCRADLVLGMVGHHAAAVARTLPEAAKKTLILADFLPEPPYALEDPWGRPDEVFAAHFARIEQAVAGLVRRLSEVRA